MILIENENIEKRCLTYHYDCCYYCYCYCYGNSNNNSNSNNNNHNGKQGISFLCFHFLWVSLLLNLLLLSLLLLVTWFELQLHHSIITVLLFIHWNAQKYRFAFFSFHHSHFCRIVSFLFCFFLLTFVTYRTLYSVTICPAILTFSQ